MLGYNRDVPPAITRHSLSLSVVSGIKKELAVDAVSHLFCVDLMNMKIFRL